MVMSAPKPCTVCGVLVRTGGSRCEAHAKKETGFSRRLSRHERGYGASWDKLRKVVLTRDAGLCVPCRKRGVLTPGNTVDHIKPKAEGGDDEMANLQTICKRCHTSKTALESARAGGTVSLLPEWLPSPRIPVAVVAGPPGSGKSSYVREHAAPADLVLDVDELAAELTGKPLYHATREETMAAIRLRNKRLADLAEADVPYSKCWLIVTASTPNAREFWHRKMSSPVHVMPTPKVECVSRIYADTRRPEAAKRSAVEAVWRWA